MDKAESASHGAGVSSARQHISQEPSFTRKRRLQGVSSEGVIQHEVDSAPANEKNLALLFKVGQRRPQPAPIPSEYQMQYTWKGGPRFEAPLLAADRLVHNGGARDERRGGGGGGKGRPGVGSLANDNQHPISADGGQKPSLNGSSKGDGGEVRNGTKGSKSLQREQRQHQCHRPVARLRSRGKTAKKPVQLGQSEYRTQFKAWPIPTASRVHGKRREKVRSPRKRSDITDHRLVSPPPLLPDAIPGPLQSGGCWGTEYSTRYRSPLNFQYVRGAWVETPQPPTSPNTQLQGGKGDDEVGEDTPPSESSQSAEEDTVPPQESLLAQLSEIRRKAEEYRQRSEGCQFLPVYPTWRQPGKGKPDTHDHSSSKSPSPSPSLSSGVSSPSEEPTHRNTAQPHTPHHHEQPSHRHMSHPHTSHSHHLTNGDLHIEDIEGEEEEEEEEGKKGEEGEREVRVSVSKSVPEVADEALKHNSHSAQRRRERKSQPPVSGNTKGSKPRTISPLHPSNTDPCDGGRVPTPILRETPGETRHHLDRTTPSAGAVLTSPPLSALLRPSLSSVSHTAGGQRRRKSGTDVGAGSLQMSSQCRGKKEKVTASKPSAAGKTGLYLSRGSLKLKRDPSLVSNLRGDSRSSSQRHTLPKSPTSHKAWCAPSGSHLLHQSTHVPPSTQHMLTTSQRPPSPPSTISSLLSSEPSSSSAIRRLDYGTSSHRPTQAKYTRPVQSSQPAHSHIGCSGAQCDICGAWLRKSHTGTRVSNAGSQVAPSHTHRYKGPVTQLSQADNHSTPRGLSSSNIPPEEPQSRGATYPDPQGAHPLPLKEADSLSISSLSLSSCSMASDLLKRARDRRQKFWTQPPPHSTS